MKQLSMRMKRGLPIILLLLSGWTLQAQEREIRGVVKDQTGEPLIGVAVIAKGTQSGAVTNIDGEYLLKAPATASVLAFSFLGMESQEIAIGNKTVIDVVMRENSIMLDDVVVVGYGVAKKKDLTGSVVSISGKELKDLPVTNVAQALGGRLAGVQATVTDGAPDAEIKIRIRGGGSITQDNSPLYIVDGFPVDHINDIPPTDIASIDILKDASSTAIYGARGANGVVIVTTKSPAADRTSVNYNTFFQAKKISKKLEVLDPYEFALYQYEYAQFQDPTVQSAFRWNYGEFDDLDIYKSMQGTDWQEEMFGGNVHSWYHNLSISGGAAKTNYGLSLTYNDDEGLLINSGYERTTLNLKINHQLSSRIKLNMGARLSDAVVRGAGTGSGSSFNVKNAISRRPISGISEWGGLVIDESLYEEMDSKSLLYNPIELIQQDYKRNKSVNLALNAGLSIEILKGLIVRSDFSKTYSNQENRRFYGPKTNEARNSGGFPVARAAVEQYPNWQSSNTLTYAKELDKVHDINLMAGFEARNQSGWRRSSTTKELPHDITPERAFASMQLGSREFTETNVNPDDRLLSYFGRANYAFNDKYLLTLVMRADGSNKFAPGNQWDYFPSAALAWRISEEPFMKNLTWLTGSKLRLSYGEAGNNRIESNLWRKSYSLSTYNSIAFNENPTTYYNFSSNTLTNPDLKWETTITRNLGLDLTLFGRINATIDVYKNTTKDLLLKANIPAQTGFSKVQENIGSTSNRGFEISLNGRLISKKKFVLNANFNVSVNRNRVEELNGVTYERFQSGWLTSTPLNEPDDYVLQVGQPVGLIYGYVTEGMYAIEDFEYNPVNGKYTLLPGVSNSFGIGRTRFEGPGALKLKRLRPVTEEDGLNPMVTPEDRTVIGDTNPEHTGGFGFNGVLYGFDFSVFFNWVYGNDVYNANKILFTTAMNRPYYNVLSIMDSNNRFRYFDAEGVKVTDPDRLREINEHATIWSPFMENGIVHSWAVEDGSFLRLNNITVGYSLPDKLISKIKMTQCRFYASINNLWTWTTYSGYDPEVDAIRSTPLTPGVDYSAYPKSRSLALGVNLSF